jgi:hypothetical protein
MKALLFLLHRSSFRVHRFYANLCGVPVLFHSTKGLLRERGVWVLKTHDMVS